MVARVSEHVCLFLHCSNDNMLCLPNINVQPLTFAQLDGSDDSFNISLFCQPWEEHNGFVHN